MYTIGQLSQRCGLSRSTLLYYDRIGLLSASHRSAGKYRLYTDDDLKRLDQILIYRQTGLSLKQIKQQLSAPLNDSTDILKQRLENLNKDIAELRQQQQTVIKLLQNDSLFSQSRSLTKNKWVEILRATGLSDSDMHQWHVEFERSMPQAHQDFLELLGISENEIKIIRAQSR